MKRILPVIVLLATIVFGATEPEAKPLARIIRDIGLTPDDFTMFRAAENSLYATASPRPGKVVSWSNPESSSHGTVKLAALRKNCAYLKHFVFPRGDSKSKEIRLRLCQDAQGKWRLQP